MALILLSTFQKELQGPAELSQFLSLFNQLASKLTDVEQFRRKARDLYLNDDLLEACRSLILENKYQAIMEAPQAKHPVEGCPPETPYCAWIRTVFKKENTEFVIRSSTLIDCLKYNYFDPFKFRFNFSFTVNFLRNFKGVSFERLNRNFYHKRNSSIDANLHNPPTELELIRTTFSDKLLNDRSDTDDFTYSHVSVKSTEDDLLILRSGHICNLIKNDYFQRRRTERFKQEYFYIVHKILFKYLGRTLKCYTFQDTRIDGGPLANGHHKAVLEQFKPFGNIKKPANTWKNREKTPEINVIDQLGSQDEDKEREVTDQQPPMALTRVLRERKSWSFVQRDAQLSEDLLTSLRLLEVVYLNK